MPGRQEHGQGAGKLCVRELVGVWVCFVCLRMSGWGVKRLREKFMGKEQCYGCLLYTSDAADEDSSV